MYVYGQTKNNDMNVLLSYEIGEPLFTPNDNWSIPVTLKIEQTRFFGLFRKIITRETEFHMFHDIHNTKKNWDRLIKDKTPIR